MINSELLINEVNKIGVSIDAYAVDRFDYYADRLVTWNKHVNLTSITDPDEIVIKHFADSLSILKYVDMKAGQKLIDVGTGAGFPGLPLLIANPKLDVTFLDSLKKRLYFIREILNNGGLLATTKHGRAEEVGKDDSFREQYDYATARAVAPLNVLCEYCMPFVKVGGLFIAMKGATAKQELDEARNAIKTLGGKLENIYDFDLSNGDKRSIIIIRKVSQTPTKYPRRSKRIDTKPL